MMMMMMLIKKNPSSYVSFFIKKSVSLSKLNLYSTSTSEKLPQTSNFMRDYLISSCGFSPSKATTLSKRVSYINSPERPDSVIHFLKQNGFNEEHVRKIIASCPFVCGCNVEQVIKPNFQALRDLGFTDQEFFKFIVGSPHSLYLSSAITHIEYWNKFFGGDMNKLLLAFTRNRGLVCLHINNNVIPKISLLKKYGFKETDIRKGIIGHHCFMTRSILAIEEMLKLSLKLGFKKGSVMCLHSLSVLGRHKDDRFKEKVEFYRTFGWSESDLLSAMKKNPIFLNLSKENIKAKIECLVKCAGCTQSYIASRPSILMYSSKNRLAPRCQVINILKSGVSDFKEMDVYKIMSLTEEQFKKYILQFKDEIPELMETYNALRSSQISH